MGGSPRHATASIGLRVARWYDRRMEDMDAEPRSPRLPYLVSALCAGAAVALVVYRFAIVGFGWYGSASFLLPALTMGVLAGCAAWVRAQPEPRRWPALPLVFALGIAGAGVAVGVAYLVMPPLAASRLTTRELPGFSFDLPSGQVSRELLEYDMGALQLSDAGGHNAAVAVHWEAGAASADDLEIAGRVLASALGANGETRPTQVPGPGGSPADTIVVASDKGPLWMTMLPCGKRRIILATIGGGTGVESLHRRIVTSFACKPVAERENARLGEVPIFVELPGWFAAERQPGLLTLSDGNALLLVRAMPQAELPHVEKLLPMIFESMGARVEIGSRAGARTNLTATIDGDRVEGWLLPMQCPQRTVVLLGLTPDRAAADDLARKVAGARCLGADEPVQTWPDPPPP